MMRYSRNEKTKGSRFGKKTTRSHHKSEDTEHLNRIIGAILISTMILGVVCSIWFGWNIRKGLNDLDHEKISRKQLEKRGLILTERQARLISKEMIEKKASVLGLRKPKPAQIIRP